MHRQAELGAAAHFAYSEAKNKGIKDEKLEGGTGFRVGEKMGWIKQLATWQEAVSSSKEFAHSVRLDALSAHIYVFSPKGDVFDLPLGATPVDYAFAVHTDLGNFIQSAKVNGKMVPLNFKLKSGDMIQISKSKNPHLPTRDWLRFVKTSKARSRIHQALV